MSVDREMEEEGQEEEENKPEPEDEATQLQDTMQRYFSAANQSVKNPTTYSPPPALSPRPISEHAQTPAPQTQPSFQIKGLASASASTSTSAPTPTPAPAKEISRSMKKKLNRQGGNSTQGQRRTKESRDEEYESKKLQWEQERELGVLREKETRPKAVSAWAPVGEKDAYGNANFGMQKGPYGEGH